MPTLLEEAQRVLTGIRVPTDEDFDNADSDWLPADALGELAADLSAFPELGAVSEFTIRYGWKREGGKTGEAGYCKKLSAEARFLAEVDFFIWLAADQARELSQRQLEALLFHELCHVGKNDKGKAEAKKHDVELFTAEVRRYGAWNFRLDAAHQAFEQLALSL